MANIAPDRRGLLRQEGSDLSDAPSSIDSAVHQRHPHQRMDSQGQQNFTDPAPKYTSPTISINEFGGLDHGPAGLGLGFRDHRNSIPRRPVGHPTSPESPPTAFTPNSSAKPSPNTAPGSSNPLLSPAWTRLSGDYGGRLGEIRDQGLGDDTPKRAAFVDASGYDGERQNNYDNDNDKMNLLNGCPAKHDIHSSRKSWLSISILMLSIYSTLFSGIWLLVAIIQPRYGRMIHSGGSFTPATASIIFALLAKTIELSFVTVFVTFLGQVLSRRSLIKKSRGVTIAELTLRTWVIQPGFMITHGEYLKHAGLTVLGGITLTAAFVALFYTTASDAIVSPHLKYGGWQMKVMEGLVKTSYANSIYINKYCRTPITLDLDSNAGTTCLDVEHAGQAYHDSISYLDTWTEINEEGVGVSSDITKRPPAPAMLYDNTTVVGSWVLGNFSNMTESYAVHNRIINNVTLSMPHAGIFAAARAQKNGILQPEELAGLGEYSIRASVVSPSLNVLCVNMLQSESDPLVYTQFPHARLENSTTMPGTKVPVIDYQNDVQFLPGKSYLNSTPLDDIFQWGEKYQRQPPIFPKYPIDYNSVTNITVSGSLYMLIKSAATANYTICQLRSFLNPFCSTHYNVSGLTGGHLNSNCDDPSDPTLYSKSTPDPPVNPESDWRDVGSEFMLSTSLNTGVSDANASTSRLLANLIPTMPPSWEAVAMPPLMPTIAETLAVMAGHTLLMSSTDASFYHFWNYTAHILDPGVWQPFNASIASEQYTSGLQQSWQGIFYIVLVLVFATNVFCLTYFFLRSGLVTDYTEPQNLFALAVNSPPSERLSGSCGAGPEGEQLNVDWHVLADESTGHFLIKEGEYRGKGYEMRNRRVDGDRNLRSMTSYSRLSNHRSSWL